MKKFIIVMLMAFAFAVTSARAEIALATQNYILDTVPGVDHKMAQSCANAYHHGGTYRHVDADLDLTLTCTKHTIRKEYDPSKI